MSLIAAYFTGLVRFIFQFSLTQYGCDYEGKGYNVTLGNDTVDYKSDRAEVGVSVCGFDSLSPIVCGVTAVNSAGQSPVISTTVYTSIKGKYLSV